MALAQLNGAIITDWPSFHTECQSAFGFPEFYGRNLDAWVDCLSYLRDAENMTKFRLKPNETLQIEILQAATMQSQAPEILEEIQFCIEGINERYEDYGEKPALELILG